MTKPTYTTHARIRSKEQEQIITTSSQRGRRQEPQLFEPFTLFFEQAPYPIWIFDVDTLAFLAVNEAALAHYGYSRQEWFSMTAKDLLAPHEIPRVLEIVAARGRGERTLDVRGVWMHRKKDGSMIDADVTVFPTFFEGHHSLVVFMHDITERRKAQEERMALLEAVLRSLPAAIVLAEIPSGKILLVNERVEALFGVSSAYPDALKQVLCAQTFHPSGRRYAPEESPLFCALLNGASMRDHEVLFYSAEGTFRTLSVYASPVRDAEGVPFARVITFLDVTERKRVQEERERLLQERVEAQEEATRRMDEFLGIASHELKTPLTIIAGMIDVLMMTLQQAQEGASPVQEQRVLPITDTLFTLLTSAQQEADLLVRLVSDLLDISRAQSAQLVMQKQWCDLAEIVRTTVQRQRHLAPARHLRLNIVGVDHMLVYADADRLEQVLANYISNAFKYTHVDRPVDVELRQNGQQGCVLVRDYGEGLAPEECQHVWERFYRGVGEPGKADTAGGLGLGLYISRSIIERHQGQVGVESIPGEGATFWFSIPLASEQEQLKSE